MKVHFFDQAFVYTGKELRSHFVRARTGMYGDAAMAWVGPCDVATETLVDLEDREAGHVIRARNMLHFIVEVFEDDLLRAVFRQRLLVSIAADALREMTKKAVIRKGDDLYVGSGKLSVSIATASPVSTLIHFGINVDGAGAPVETADLLSLSVDPRALAERVLDRLAAEEEGIARARSKVRPVP